MSTTAGTAFDDGGMTPKEEESIPLVATGETLVKQPLSLEVFLFAKSKKSLAVLLALSFSATIWNMAPLEPLDENGMNFLVTLGAAVVLWAFDVFDDYVVGLMLLLSWLLLGLAPSQVALNGFSSNAWFFVLGVFGMAAAVNTSGLLKRIAGIFIWKVRPTYRFYTFALSGLGFLITPLLPTTRGRIGIFAPMTQAISDTVGFKPRSNGCAGLNLSAYVGFSQMNFLFLTGSTTSLLGWSLLPEAAKVEFGWGKWLLAALPAGIVNFFLLLLAVQFLFRPKNEDQESTILSPNIKKVQPENIGRVTRNEWITLSVVCFALAGWITKPLHGVSQAWVGLAAFIALLLTGVLDKKSVKNNIDWGFLLFFGIVYSMSSMTSHLKVDVWLREMMDPLLSAFSFNPLVFLIGVMLLVYLVRFFLFKPPTVILLSLLLAPWSPQLGIHPGVLLLIMLLAMETWFFGYQQPSYQIAYSSTNETGFSHAQGRKLMVAKFAASFVVLVISLPYWSWLGFIETKASAAIERSAESNETLQASEISSDTSAGEGMPSLIRGWPENRVARIQRLLSEVGYDPGLIDGILGARTIQAIQKYQRREGLEVHGRPSRTLEAHLRQRSYRQAARKLETK